MELVYDDRCQIYKSYPEDWKKIKKRIIEIDEKAFEKRYRDSEKSMERIFTDSKNLNLIAYAWDELCGYSIGGSMKKFKDRSKKPWIYPSLEGIDDSEIFYIYGTGIDPKFQGNGIGTKLIEVQIDLVRSMEYKAMTSHALNDIIKHIEERFGFEEKGYIEGEGIYMVLIFDDENDNK